MDAASGPAYTRRVQLSIYPPNSRANADVQAVDWSWETFVAWLATVCDTDDKHHQGFSPLASIAPGKGGRVHGGPASFVAFEYDEGATPELLAHVCDLLDEDGYDAILYTSANARADCPRFRVIMRVDRAMMNGSEYRATVDAIGEWIGTPPAPESRQRTRMWYRPIRGSQVRVFSGDYVWEVAEGAPEPPPKAPVDLARWTPDERAQQAWAALDRRRPDGGFAACAICHDYGLGVDEMVALITRYGQAVGWTEFDEIERCARNVEAYAREPSGNALVIPAAAEVVVETAEREIVVGYHPHNDRGNADRLLANYGTDLRYVRGLGWYRWGGTVWEPQPGGPIGAAAACAEAVRAEGAKVGGDEGKKLASWGTQSGNLGRLRAAVSVAETRAGVSVDVDDMEANPWVIACANGVIDLQTGLLRDGSRDDLLTKQLGLRFNLEARAPRFERFLMECMGGSAEWVGYLQRWMGYCLTGSVSEHMVGIWYGATGANGKSTLLRVMEHVMGPYMGTCAPDLLLSSGAGQHPTALADLQGMRLMITSEIEQGARMNERLIKQITGGDPIRARKIGCDAFEFTPTCKLLLAANSLPRAIETGQSLWRRAQIVPWEQNFAGREDRKLVDTLIGEAEGVLAWMVRGCVEWSQRGLELPQSGRDAVEEYRRDQDMIGQWIEDCLVTDEGGRVKRAELYDSYRMWCAESGISHPYTRPSFVRVLRERGMDCHKSDGHYILNGWRIR